MSKVLTDLLIKRATQHAEKGFLYVLDYESGETEAITFALIEAASVPQALKKLNLEVAYPEGGNLSTAKVQSFQKGLQNAFQKTSFVEGYKADLDQFAAELWAYLENTCLALEGIQS